MMFSSDVMGSACEAIEEATGSVALFINGDAGDTNPDFGQSVLTAGVACQDPPTPADPYSWSGGPVIAAAVMQIRNSTSTSSAVGLTHYSERVSFGPTNLNMTLGRVADCKSGGELDICSLCGKITLREAFLDCDLNAHLPESWVEDTPRFTALRWEIDGEVSLMVTIPGEALVETGWWIRNGTLALGYNRTFLLGYTNDYMGYFATPDQYDLGGYESIMTFWGINTAAQVNQVHSL